MEIDNRIGSLSKLISWWAGAVVWLLWKENHDPEVVSSNPGTMYWMSFFAYLFVVKFVMCV